MQTSTLKLTIDDQMQLMYTKHDSSYRKVTTGLYSVRSFAYESRLLFIFFVFIHWPV